MITTVSPNPFRRHQVVIAAASAVFDVSVDAVLSDRKYEPLPMIRGVIVDVMRRRTRLSYPDLARLLNWKSHTSAMHARKQFIRRRDESIILAGPAPQEVTLGELADRVEALVTGAHVIHTEPPRQASTSRDVTPFVQSVMTVHGLPAEVAQGVVRIAAARLAERRAS